MMYTDHPRVLGVSALESFFDIAPAHRKALFDGASHKNHGKDLRERKAYLKLLLQEGDK